MYYVNNNQTKQKSKHVWEYDETEGPLLHYVVIRYPTVVKLKIKYKATKTNCWPHNYGVLSLRPQGHEF